MYRQILTTDKYRDYQIILWRTDPNQPIDISTEYGHIRHGTCIIFSDRFFTIAEMVPEQYPYITPIINRDFYMDDILTGADTEQEVIKIRDGLIVVMNSAGLTLRKWSSNDANLITSSLPSEDIQISNKHELNYSLKKVLGLF